MGKKFRGSLMLLGAAFIWGTAFVAQSEGAEHVGAFTYNCARSFAGGIFLVAVLAVLFCIRKSRGNSSEKKNIRETVKGGIVCGAVLAAASAFQQAGIALTSAGKAGFITALYIIFVPLAGIPAGKKVTLRIWCCAAAAVAGFYFLSIKNDLSAGKGDLLVLACAVLFTFHIIVTDHFAAAGTDSILMSCIQFFTAGIISFPFMIFYERPDVSNIFAAAVPVLYAGIFSSGVAYTLQIAGQKHTPPAAATLIMSLESVFAALAGWLVLGEVLSFRELTGCMIVFAAVIVSQIPDKINVRDRER